MKELSIRTRELLDILTIYSNRTRYTWIILNIISLILLSAIINEKIGGTKPRVAVRFWNTNLDLIDNGKHDNSSDQSTSNNENYEMLSNKLLSRDSLELNKLISQQLTEYESVKIPLIGVSISSRDASFVGAIALLIIYLWYLLSVIKERSVLAQLIYPLIARSSDEKAKNLWGERGFENFVDEEKLKRKILEYKVEVFHIKEAISSKFLTLYSSSKRRWFEYLTTGVLTFMPLLLLISSLSLDFYWDFGKTFPETNNNFYCEISDYQEKLFDKSEDIKEINGDLSLKLKIASEQLKDYKNVMLFKRITSLIIVIILSSICVFDFLVAKSMTIILTNMNQQPERLDLEKYVDA